MKMANRISILAAAAMLIAAGTANAVPITWTDWTDITATSATGTMGGVGVTISASILNGPSQTGCGTNYWTEPNAADPAYTGGTADNAPTPCEQVAINSATTVTVTFDSLIDSLYMALLSIGQPGLEITYDFDQSFVIDSEGQGFFGNDATDGVLGAGDTLAMREFHGLLLFDNPVSSLTFTTSPNENWHAFTFGSARPAVAEPATLALLGLGLAGLGFARWRTRH